MASKKPLEVKHDTAVAKAALKEIGKEIGKEIREGKHILYMMCAKNHHDEIVGITAGHIRGMSDARDILTAKLKKGGK